MKQYIIIIFFLAGVSFSSFVDDKAKPPPNIIFILVDDLGIDQIGSYGSENKTVNIDRLASEGIRFKTAYTAPICSPSRALLMTGRYGFRTGWLNFTGRPYSPTATNPKYDLGIYEKTIFQVLKQHGYKTGLVGRWLEYGNEHIQIPNAGIDDYQIWAIWGDKLPPGVTHTGAWEKGKVTSRFWNPCIIRNGNYIPTQPNDYSADLMLEYSKKFIHENQKKPFMLFYPMILTHDPYVEVPDLENPGKRKAGNLKEYVEYADYLIGDLINYLDSLGLNKNTIVIFAGDNGTHAKGKGTPTEKGSRVPFIIRYPEVIKAGTVSDELTDFSDIFPTLVEFAGGEMPKDIKYDGKSLVPTLQGNPQRIGNGYIAIFKKSQVLRDKRWLYEDGRFFDCGDDRDGNYKEVTLSVDPEVSKARARFDSILYQFVVR